jgi:hypothetical protein
MKRARQPSVLRALSSAEPRPFWLDRPPPAREPLRGDGCYDLAVVGGGFTGL